jgi:hypothetical protein
MFEDAQAIDLAPFFAEGPEGIRLFAHVLLQELKRQGAEVVFSNMKLYKTGDLLLFTHHAHPGMAIGLRLEPNQVALEITDEEEDEVTEEEVEEIFDTIFGGLPRARSLALMALLKEKGGPSINIRKRKRNGTNRNNRNTNMGGPSAQRIRLRRSRKTRKTRRA